MMKVRDWREYITVIGGIPFRPVSMGSLTMLFEVKSPLVYGGMVEPLDFAVFAWIHSAPITDILTAIKAEQWEKEAVIWASELPTEVYASYTLPTIKALAKDLSKIFIDKDTGFLPFPLPSQCKPSWRERALIFIKHLFTFG